VNTIGSPIREEGFWSGFAVLFALIASSLSLVVFLSCYLSSFGSLGATISENDFQTNSERLEFVNQHLPEPLPAEANVRKIRYASWQDWNLASVVDMPSSNGQDYINRIRELSDSKQSPNENTATFELSGDSKFAGKLIFDSETSTLKIESFNW
jgi:hypothetical protein